MTVPLVGSYRRAISCEIVVFPLPLGPTNASIVPGLILKETSLSTKLFVSFSIFPSLASSSVSRPTSALVG